MTLTLPVTLIEDIDHAAGYGQRSAWIREQLALAASEQLGYHVGDDVDLPSHLADAAEVDSRPLWLWAELALTQAVAENGR